MKREYAKRDKETIRLNDIPDEGKFFSYNRTTGEFGDALDDLIQDRPYSIDFEIKPSGNIHNVQGTLNLNMPCICSKCGESFDLEIKKGFHEVLLPKTNDEKGDSQSKSGFLSEGDVAARFIEGDILDVEDMVHEVIALQEPPYPMCGGSVCLNSELIDQKMKLLEEEAAAALSGAVTKENPFAALKDLKIN